jgi:enterochelin esterase family protein
VWTTTVGPLEPDIYSYRVTIDGSDVPTPLSESAVDRNSGWGPTQFEIPGSAWTLRAVAHGTVTSVLYHSKALGGMFRAVNVYTPPGYDSSAARFPVLYLLHGAGGTESSWMISGRANLILDNLIADGAARPMIVVMPFGHLEQTKALQLPEVDAPVGRTFSDDLLGDVVPMVEQRFRVSRSADQRAIAGLSMGGAQALEIGLSHPDLFHWIAGFSSALYVPAYSSFPVQGRIASLSIADATTMNKAIKLLWVACGRQDGLLTNSRLFVNTLEARGLHHTFVTTEGAHEWAVWRRNLADLVPQLFVAR